jgi:multiple sugar transport system substrate-binding protein
MPVLAGLAVAKGAPNPNGAAALIDFLTKPETQIATARAVGFFPVVNAPLPADLDPGLKLAVAAITARQRTRFPACCRSGWGRKAESSTRCLSILSS